MERKVKKQIEDENIICSQSQGTFMCQLNFNGGSLRTFNIGSRDLRLAIKILWEEVYGDKLSDKDVAEIISILEIECFKSVPIETQYHRVYVENKKVLLYDLNATENTCVWVEEGVCSIEQTPEFIFKRTSNFQNQITPDFSAEPQELLDYVFKHFNVKSEDDGVMLAVYLVSCLCGMDFNHPCLLIQGEKGSGKSQCLKKIEQIVDPKKSGVCSMPTKKDAIVLRLSNSYMTCWDNVSYIPKSTSDYLCMAVTGASDTDRKLYCNTEERIINLHSIIAITCINVVAKSSDLVDRCCLIKLNRFKESEIRTEEEIMDEFYEDLPRILGAIFNTIALVMSSNKKVNLKRKIRLADFHEMAVRIGRVLEISKSEITRILFQNKMEMSLDVLEASGVAMCLSALMKHRKTYKDTPTNCLNDLKRVALKIGVDISTLPKDASRLTRAIIPIISELSTVYGIDFSICRETERQYLIVNTKLKDDDEV